MIGHKELYLELDPDLLKEGSALVVPSRGVTAYFCEYAHPIRHCTRNITGKLSILRMSPDRIDMHVKIRTLEQRIDWTLKRGIAFPRQ
jgi:hypothetical protein